MKGELPEGYIVLRECLNTGIQCMEADEALGRMKCPRNNFVNAIKIITLGSLDYEILKNRLTFYYLCLNN